MPSTSEPSVAAIAAALDACPDITGVKVGTTAYGLWPSTPENKHSAVARVRATPDQKSHITVTFARSEPTPTDTAALISAVLAAATAVSTGIKSTELVESSPQ